MTSIEAATLGLRKSIDPPECGEVDVSEEEEQSFERNAQNPERNDQRGLDPCCEQESRSSSVGGLESKHDGDVVPYNHDAPSESPSPSLGRDDELARKSASNPDPCNDMRRGFDHCFVTVPCKERLSVLFATLRRSQERKVIVICSTWESAAYHAVLFRQFEMLHVYEMHEHMEQGNVARAYDEFLDLYPGILFASEVSMREFDVPANVDYLIQFEPPMNPTEYIYRMNKAEIYRTSCHKALLFLSPEELRFLEYFHHIPTKELEARRVSEFQGSVQKLLTKHDELNHSAWKAFRAFVTAYKGHSFSDIYDPETLDEEGTRRSFGQPRVPEYSSKYFVYNKKDTDGKGVPDDLDNGKEESHPHEKWRNKKETTWRRGSQSKPWIDRESRTWKHTKKSLEKDIW